MPEAARGGGRVGRAGSRLGGGERGQRREGEELERTEGVGPAGVRVDLWFQEGEKGRRRKGERLERVEEAGQD